MTVAFAFIFSFVGGWVSERFVKGLESYFKCRLFQIRKKGCNPCVLSGLHYWCCCDGSGVAQSGEENFWLLTNFQGAACGSYRGGDGDWHGLHVHPGLHGRDQPCRAEGVLGGFFPGQPSTLSFKSNIFR